MFVTLNYSWPGSSLPIENGTIERGNAEIVRGWRETEDSEAKETVPRRLQV